MRAAMASYSQSINAKLELAQTSEDQCRQPAFPLRLLQHKETVIDLVEPDG